MIDQINHAAAYTAFIHFLRSTADIPDHEVRKAVDLFKLVRLDKSAFFIRAGEIPQTFGFVVSGLLRLYYIDAAGVEYTKSFCVENEVVAAYSALLLDQPSRLYIEALEDSCLLIAPYQQYQIVSDQHVSWQIVNRKLAETLFIKKEQRESDLLLDDATARYLKFLQAYPGLEPRLKQHHIGSYLGITPVSLSRIRAQLKNN